MNARPFAAATAVLGLAALCGCEVFDTIGLAPNEGDPGAVRRAEHDLPPGEPAHVVVQHLLVSFEGTDVPTATRSKEEAERLARKLHASALAGDDFGELVRLHSDDVRSNGTYRIANWGVPLGNPEETERQKLVRGFGDVAFSLKVGDIGLVEYDALKSPLGWHVMKRIE